MERTSFNAGWRFARRGDLLRAVPVPHDAMLTAPRRSGLPGGGARGHYTGEEYVYEKTFPAPENYADRHLLLEFEAVYRDARVFVNGRPAGGGAHGLLPFLVPLDGLLCEGANTVRVECAAPAEPGSRRYTGAGLLRSVWLWQGPPHSLPPHGVWVRTAGLAPARVRVTTSAPEPVYVELRDGDTVVAAGKGADITLTVPDARLWSAEAPYLYTCRVLAGPDADEAEVTFGIQQITWDGGGLYVNGATVLLRGGGLHYAAGLLGAAAWPEEEERRVRRLKAAGFNAVRCAGHPAPPALLEACDRLGLYVIEEPWEGWYHPRAAGDCASHWRENYRADLRTLAERDRSHPSLLLWSLGSELTELAEQEGLTAARDMVESLRTADGTRPVTAGVTPALLAAAARWPGGQEADRAGETLPPAISAALLDRMVRCAAGDMERASLRPEAVRAAAPPLTLLDVPGTSYADRYLCRQAEGGPDRPLLALESLPPQLPQLWAAVRRYRALAGVFVWSAWDYLGEAGLGAWSAAPDGRCLEKPYPWRLAGTGLLDLLGDAAAGLALTQAAWGLLETPVILVRPPAAPGAVPVRMPWRASDAVPGWCWPAAGERPLTVEVYAGNGACVALYRNGQAVGQKPLKNGVAEFRTRYEPGALEAAALDAAGAELARGALHSPTGTVRVALAPEAPAVRPGGLAYIAVTLQGENGARECGADRVLNAVVTGGTLLGFGNADPRSAARWDAGRCATWHGRALAVVLAGTEGELTLTVTDPDGQSTAVALPIA